MSTTWGEQVRTTGGGLVVVGGAGFVGRAIAARPGPARVAVVDARPPREPAACFVQADLLEDELVLPPGRVVLAHGSSLPRPRRPWLLPYLNALTTARLSEQLTGRDVVLLSSVEVYGWAAAPLTEQTAPRLPVGQGVLERWCDRAAALAAWPVTPERAERLCRELCDLDPSGRWIYALSKLSQELLLRRTLAPERLTIVRVANVFGPGQDRVVGRMARAVLAGRPVSVTRGVARSFVALEDLVSVVLCAPTGTWNVASGTLELAELAELVMATLGRQVPVVETDRPAYDSCGVVDATSIGAHVRLETDLRASLASHVRAVAERSEPLFDPPLPVVIPPRPERPERVMRAISRTLWTGRVKYGVHVRELTDRLTQQLGIDGDRRLVVTNSGTNALRMGVAALVGRVRPGDVAVLPSFTFPATGEVLRQLGFRLRFADIDARRWTLDPAAVAAILDEERVRLVVTVDAMGNPCDYEALAALCSARGVPLLADSAAAVGARSAGRPVGTQVDAHAFSLSFAKVLSGAGSGGFAVLPASTVLETPENWYRSSWMTEISAIATLDLLDHLDELLARRRAVADVYEASIATRRGFASQAVAPRDTHAWVHWAVRCSEPFDRDELASGLAALGVETKPYYWPLLHLGEPPGEASPTCLPITESVGREVLALPISSEMTLDDAERVVMAVDAVTATW
jgi:dTDP-4-amino-4,6-dideoxygalactose transaminase/nucleoside-diphosphate-sugar epimerase